MRESCSAAPPLPPRQPREAKPRRTMSVKNIYGLIDSKCGPISVSEHHGKGRNKVFFLPEAARELCQIVSYGRRSPMNRLEQKFAGFGHFLTTDAGDDCIVVSHFIQIHTTNRSTISANNLGANGGSDSLNLLEYYREEYLENERECNTDAQGRCVDPFLELCGPSEFVLEGHTHPNLGVFWSRADRTSGSARAAVSPVCIFVCDPIRREMLGCTGKDFRPAEVIVCENETRGRRQKCRRPAPEAENPDPVAAPQTDPRESPGRDAPETPPPHPSAGKLISLCDSYLALPGVGGHVRKRVRRGKLRLKIDLILPVPRKGGEP